MLAYLCEANAIPLELSVVGHLSYIVHHVLSVSTLTKKHQIHFSANVYHVPRLCLLGFSGISNISHKIMAQKPHFYIFDFSETTSR